MKTSMLLTFIALAFLGLGVPLHAAEHNGPAGCIELWPDQRGFDSMLPDEGAFSRSTQERLTGATARIVVYVDRWDSIEGSSLVPFPQEMFVFATTSGRYLARIVDLPTGHGWFGPF